MRAEPAATALAALTTRVLVCGLALALGTATLTAQPAPARADEGAVKAAFVLNFAKFVQWAPATARPILICVSADGSFSDSLARLVRGHAVDGRAITAQHLGETDDPNRCDLVFVSAGRQRHSAELLQRIKTPTLTMGETAQFMREGGVVRLFVEDNRLRFQINRKAAEATGIKLSSKLLALSR